MAVADAGLLRVARCLALDALAVRAVAALDARGIDAVVLKGPATVHWIYADIPGRRNYGDIDVLVAPEQWGPAVDTLCALGMTDVMAGIRASEAALLYERALVSADGLNLDLHRSFFGVRDPETFWHELTSRTITIPIAGTPLAITDKVPAALVLALHAAQNGGARATVTKPQHDLERSLQLFDESVWRAALDLARQVGAEASFAAGLSLAETGRALLARLESRTGGDPMAALRSSIDTRRGDTWFGQMWAQPGLRSRVLSLRDGLAPSPAMLKTLRPAARRNRTALACAYLQHWALLPLVGPRAAVRWRRAQRMAVRMTVRTPQSRRIRARRLNAALRLFAGGDRSRAATLVWTLSALRAARVQLRTMAPPAVTIAHPRPARVGTPDVMRRRAGAVRLVLKTARATCLEECVVRQRWLAAAGVPAELVVGVTSPRDGFRAHAWLPGDRVPPGFTELTRYPAG